MTEQIQDAYLKHSGLWGANGGDYNMFAAGWLKARAAERARCAAIAQSYTDDAYQDPAQFVAREIQRAILND